MARTKVAPPPPPVLFTVTQHDDKDVPDARLLWWHSPRTVSPKGWVARYETEEIFQSKTHREGPHYRDFDLRAASCYYTDTDPLVAVRAALRDMFLYTVATGLCSPVASGQKVVALMKLYDWVQKADQVFTVTVAGSERHNGEKPFTYVLRAANSGLAGATILGRHWRDTGDPDLVLVSTTPGVPAADCGYHWNDLR